MIVKDEEYSISCTAEGNNNMWAHWYISLFVSVAGSPAPSTSVMISSSATQQTNIPVRKEGDSFLFSVPEFLEQVQATCVATNTAGTVRKHLDIAVICKYFH